MELPQPKPFGIEGTGRKTTHDFLSLYTAAHQDQRSTQGKGGFIQTHDFLQPLEQLGKNGIREEDQEVDILDIKDAGKPRPPPGVVAVGPTLPVEHTLPGGIGTYSITSYNQRMMIPISKAEEYNNNMMMAHAQAHTHAQANSNSCRNDENSNSSSYTTTTTTGNVFTLWDESAAAVVNNMKGKTGKENIASNRGAVLREGGINQGNGQWTMPMDNNNPSSNHNQNTTTFSSPSSSQPSSANRNQSFMDMITSTKNNHHEEDDEEEEEEFVIKNEPSSYSRGNLSVKVDGKSTGQKPNTPRSKHSATEQRRRSKINDRFQKLREIIPHGDQKRDKASFLLEVIEYIQYLQEKVHKYDSNTYHGWSHEPPKIMPRINHRNTGDFMNQIQPTNVGSCPTVLLGTKFDETKAEKSTGLLLNGHPLVELDMSNAPNLRDNIYQTEPITKVEPAVQPQLPNNFCPVGTTLQPFSSSTSQQEGDVDKMPCHQPNTQIRSGGANSSITDKVKNRELCIESGAISISSRYSQGLLNNLTQALQSSGVDLSQASISVQIDLGKRANADVNTSTSIMKDNEIPKMNQEMPTTSSSMKNNNDESFQAMKRIKTSRS